MKLIKKADLVTSFILILGGTVYSIMEGFDGLYQSYIVVGLWQVLSAATHAISRDQFIAVSGRKTYERTLLILIGIVLFSGLSALAGFEIGIFIGYLVLFGLLFLGPVMAIAYWVICYEEFQILRKKDFIHLK